ncbi:unnamed protein product [Arabidopsis thaliana]|uniref:3'-5' exonuclease n=1 Tax=Arabidopsis thaliana TaxID=3702 RepID=A0A7G2EZD6_ARATH|nr:unnamed protein product [Arabidopsis thaliana]
MKKLVSSSSTVPRCWCSPGEGCNCPDMCRLQHLIEDSTLVKLFHDYGVSIKSKMLRIFSDLANQKIGGDKKWGLASLTETLVCKELLKPNRIRLGNWEVHPLSKQQLQYAATDAYASWHLHQVLKDLPDAVSGS